MGTSKRAIAILQIAGWTLLFTAAIDLVINVCFPMPANVKEQPTGLSGYFEYGRSIEGKLRRSIGPEDAAASPLAVAGWIPHECQRSVPPDPGHRVISFFGMSFSNNVANALKKVDPTFSPVLFAGPSAPPNHSYRCFLQQQEFAAQTDSDASEIQVLGVLASSVKGMLSMTGATTSFEGPAPYTYPRYTLNDAGWLLETMPLVQSTDDWRRVLTQPDRAEALRSQLAEQDRFFDPFLFYANWTDRSAILRMLRRAYGQAKIKRLADSVLGPKGYYDNPEIAPVLRAMVLDFAKRSRASGKRPVVLLLQDGRSGDALFRMLAPTLEKDGVEFVSTHEIAPTSNPANFQSDGHFTEAVSERIATELRQRLTK